MSDLMLLGALRQPLPDDPAQLDPITWAQIRDRMRQAADRIEAQPAGDLQPYAAELPEPAAHMYPCDLEKFQDAEMHAPAFSLPVGSPTHGKSVPLLTEPQLRDILADDYAHYAAQVRPLAGLARPDAAAPTDTQMLDWMIARDANVIIGAKTHDGRCRISYYPRCGGSQVSISSTHTPRAVIEAAMKGDKYRGLPREVDAKPLVRQSDAHAAIAARDGHMSSMRAEITEARITIAELKADLREREERIAIIRTEWAAEVAALTERARSLDWNKEFEENVGRPPTDEDRKLMGVSE